MSFVLARRHSEERKPLRKVMFIIIEQKFLFPDIFWGSVLSKKEKGKYHQMVKQNKKIN
jgi:hypothetical protein